MKKYLSYAMLFVLVLPLNTTFANQTPEQVTVAYIDSIKKSGLMDSVQYFHPEELQKFRTVFMQVIDAQNNPEIYTAVFGEKINRSNIQDISDEQFATKVFELYGDVLKDASLGQSKVLGRVQENDLVHVLVRTSVKVKEVEVSSLQVVSTKKYQDTWKIMFNDRLNMVIQSMQQKRIAQ